MNRWKEIWQNRGAYFSEKTDVFEMFCELKRADGFDVGVGKDYYENFWKYQKSVRDRIFQIVGGIDSLFEVGCGSGVNLSENESYLNNEYVFDCYFVK